MTGAVYDTVTEYPALEHDLQRRACDMGESIKLPEPAVLGGFPIWETLKKRRTIRHYAEEPLALSVVSQLLWASSGVSGATSALRTAPSAGGKHPATMMFVAYRVTGLEPGIYRYHPVEHSLELVKAGEFGESLAGACSGQRQLSSAPAVFAWNVEAERTTGRYGDRGKRYILLDLGHACQNLYLAAAALGLGCCAIGAYSDERVNGLF
ncbi:MAG: SagB/ThcOx family dehydrogenase, partial [Ignavibacteriales bacterium]